MSLSKKEIEMHADALRLLEESLKEEVFKGACLVVSKEYLFNALINFYFKCLSAVGKETEHDIGEICGEIIFQRELESLALFTPASMKQDGLTGNSIEQMLDENKNISTRARQFYAKGIRARDFHKTFPQGLKLDIDETKMKQFLSGIKETAKTEPIKEEEECWI